MNEVRCPLNEAAHISTNEPAVVGPHGTLLYSELEQCVLATADLLERHGCRAGERIALVLGSTWEYIVVLMAAVRIGATACVLDPSGPAASRRKLLKKAGCTRVVASGRTAARTVAGIPTLDVKDLVGFTAPMKAHHHANLVMDRPAVLFCDEDAAGRTRLMARTVGGLYYGARGSNANIRLTSHDRWLLTTPVSTPAGMDAAFRCLVGGATMILPDPAQDIVAAAHQYGATHFSATTAQFQAMLNNGLKLNAMPQLRVMVLNDGEDSDGVLSRLEEMGFQVFCGYGLTDLGVEVTCTGPGADSGERRTAGRVLKYREVAVEDDGAILVRGEAFGFGREAGDGLEPPLRDDGWFTTNDRGMIDANGCLTVIGRGSKSGTMP